MRFLFAVQMVSTSGTIVSPGRQPYSRASSREVNPASNKISVTFTAACWPPAARNKCGGIEDEIIG